MSTGVLLNGLPSMIGALSPAETAAVEALCLSPVADERPLIGNQVQILIGTPTLGMVHIAWHNAMQGLVTPPNWASVRSSPTGFDVATAQNILVDSALRGNFRALLLIEDDTVPPPQTLIEMDRWFWKMERKLAPPVVSGLYHIKGSAEMRRGKTGGIEVMGPEPLIYREGGTRAYRDWTPGDVVWASGVPTGALLIHRALLEAWAREPDVETVTVPGYPHPYKRIFANPSKVWVDPGSGSVFATAGTSDLWWCAETIRRGLIAKAGWPATFARKRYPFVCDTALRFGHLDRVDGTIY